MEKVASILELDDTTVERLITAAKPPDAAAIGAELEKLEGLSVCFTGGVDATRGGVPLTRADLQASAQGRGMIVKTGVSKKLDVLVTSDPHSMSGKSKRARELGTRIMAIETFIAAIGIEVD